MKGRKHNEPRRNARHGDHKPGRKDISTAVMREAAATGHPPMKAAGGCVTGDKMSKMNLGRPGRKRGGRAGADLAPLSSASKGC